MKLTLVKKLASAAIGAALIGAATPTLALPTLTTPDGVVDPFGGFDWNSAGSAVVAGFAPVTGTAITTTYFANAVNVKLVGGANFPTPNLFPPVGTYEYTVRAIINETITCLNIACSSAAFTTTSGSWQVWYDTTPDSNLVTGAGITDGTLILAGTMNPGAAGVFIASATGGTGVFEFAGAVTFTNLAFINPALDTSNAVATLQFGTSTTGWTQPTSLPGAAGGTSALPAGAIIFQADGNQAFAVPEPAPLALAGLGLLLAGLSRRRRR